MGGCAANAEREKKIAIGSRGLNIKDSGPRLTDRVVDHQYHPYLLCVRDSGQFLARVPHQNRIKVDPQCINAHRKQGVHAQITCENAAATWHTNEGGAASLAVFFGVCIACQHKQALRNAFEMLGVDNKQPRHCPPHMCKCN